MLVDASESPPLGYFKLVFDDFIINHVVDQTNKYAPDFIFNPPKQWKENSRVNEWVPTNNAEMKTFFGLTILMGSITKPSVQLYRSKDPLYSTPTYP